MAFDEERGYPRGLRNDWRHLVPPEWRDPTEEEAAEWIRLFGDGSRQTATQTPPAPDDCPF